jgi:hypothetical protein
MGQTGLTFSKRINPAAPVIITMLIKFGGLTAVVDFFPTSRLCA